MSTPRALTRRSRTPIDGLRIGRTATGKVVMSKADEGRLSKWMSAHMRVAWMVHRAPWELEHALIASGPALPLNVAGSAHPYTALLKQARIGLGRAVLSSASV